jgi:limonene-1,2-epoxide hydrolase
MSIPELIERMEELQARNEAHRRKLTPDSVQENFSAGKCIGIENCITILRAEMEAHERSKN